MNDNDLRHRISALRSECFALVEELLRASVNSNVPGGLAVAHVQDAANRLGYAELALEHPPDTEAALAALLSR